MNFKKTLLAVALTLSAGFAMAADLPQVAILATGGTIAGTAASATQTTGYKAGDLAIQALQRASRRSEGERHRHHARYGHA